MAVPEIQIVNLSQPAIVNLSQPASVQEAAPIDLRRVVVEEFLRSSNLAANSRKAYQRELHRFMEWTDLTWRDVKPRHVAQYKQSLQEMETEQGRALSKSSINAALTALKSFFRWAATFRSDVCPTNPTAGVKFEKLPLPPAQSLTQEQMAQVWAVMDALGETERRDRVLIHLLSHGLRAGEAVALTIGAFDGRLLFLADTKTNEPRLVPLRRDARVTLTDYLEIRQRQGEVLTPERPLLLSHHRPAIGQGLTYQGVYKVIEKIGKLAKIEDLHPHQFRHTYATTLLLQGVDPTHAKRLTGHRSEAAFRRYTLRSEQEAAIAAYYRAIGELH